MKKILMIAYHYPPLRGGSGIHRTLKFSRYLPENGWQPVILTANPRAYPQVGSEQLHEIPQGVPVERAFALDAARHYSLRGAYPMCTALPDRWVSWWFGAVPAGLRLIRIHRPDVIWSTYPIATAHLIGLTLHRLSGIPWVTDFRDPMTEDGFPPDRLAWKVCREIERRSIKHSARIVFTTTGTMRMYADRYPDIPSERWKIIANGYDEEDFIGLEKSHASNPPKRGYTLLVHSGVLYPLERDPSGFFAALSKLRRTGKLSASNIRIVLRGSGNEDSYRTDLKNNEIDDLVFLEKLIPYREALAETLQADGLLLFQASNCNHQIPAKMYEYLRVGRPVFAMTDPEGDTAAALKAAGIDTIVPLDSSEAIANGLMGFLQRIREGRAPVGRQEIVESSSRKSRTREMAILLDSIA